ncbi:hypothetical protein LIER_33933 [Lithospermum erythrorhizon]|uniref:U-box domain-containing protein n=1 Tax=Lithospermum erythrorhizon TaxID=34254 RepID=A0AAV3S186_LITER
MEEVEVPSYFICPISMQMMKDPVIVSTGITYDRENIERWIFSCKNNACPVTKQELSTKDLTPNHTLRRLIQSWCTLNESHGFERIPTPRQPVEKSQILKLLNEAKSSSSNTIKIKCVEKLRSFAHGSLSNRMILEEGLVVVFLASLIKKNVFDGDINLIEKSLDILCHIDISEIEMKNLMRDEDGNGGFFLDSLMQILKCGSIESKGFAIMLIKSLFNVADPKHLISVTPEFFKEVVHVLRDNKVNSSLQVTKAALKLFVELCPWGRNRIKAVEAGAVSALIELLLEKNERRLCELMLMVLDQLCQCAEGRAELLSHGAGLAIVSKKILRVSHIASDRAVRLLLSISKFSASARVLQEMLQVGVVAKLCLVLQVDSGLKTKERTKEILKLHSRVWRESSCIPPHLLSSYPSTS